MWLVWVFVGVIVVGCYVLAFGLMDISQQSDEKIKRFKSRVDKHEVEE